MNLPGRGLTKFENTGLVYMLWISAIPTRIYELFLVVSEETGLKIDLFCSLEDIWSIQPAYSACWRAVIEVNVC
jgi:hypothetical protein